MADWSLIGGHPAPGSPEGVDVVGTALAQLAERVDNVRQDLRQTGARSGVGAWTGDAAEAFRRRISALPGELVTVCASYRQGAAAMRIYAAALRQEQASAHGAIERAEHAAADVARAEKARSNAQAQIDSLNSRLRAARAQRDRQQTQYNAAPDAQTRAALHPALETARTLVRRLENDLRAASAERDRQERVRREARSRLDDAKADGDRIRTRINAAAETAVRALERAEKDAHLPCWLARASEDTKVWVAANGPIIADSLDLGVTLFSLAAKIIPAGAPIFLALAAGCGILAITVNLAVMASTPGGVTTDRLLHLGGEVIGVFAAAAGLGALKQAAVGASAATRAATAAKAAQAAQRAKLLGNLGDVVDVTEAGAKDGWAGVERQVTGLVVGKGAGFVASRALKGAITGLNKNAATSAWLTEASRFGKRAQTAQITNIQLLPSGATRAITDDGVRTYQSVLGAGRIPPGGFLPAHAGAQYLASHALPRADTEQAFRDLGEPIADASKDSLQGRPVSWLIERFGGSAPEPTTDESDTITLPIRPSNQGGAAR